MNKKILVTCIAPLLGVVIAGCAPAVQAPPPRKPALKISPDAARYFNHFVITDQPPGAVDCCTDVVDTADVDGDGYSDVIVGSEGDAGDGLLWYSYPHWTAHPIGRGAFTTDIKAADLNGDGRVDVIVGDLSRNAIVGYEQGASRGEWKDHVIHEGYAHDLALADVNGDGRQDVLVADKKVLTLLLAQGGGTYTAQTVSTREAEGLDVADIDGDGDADILYGHWWIENRAGAEGSRWIEHDVAAEWSPETRIRAADFDGDGVLDIVMSVSEGESRGIAWFSKPEASSAGSQWTQHWIFNEPLEGVHSLLTGDFDLDGRVDVVAAEMHTSTQTRVLMFLNRTDGWETVTLATHGSHNMVARDIDNDGDLDLVGKNYAGTNRFVELWRNRAADARFTLPSLASAPDASAWSYEPIDIARPAAEYHKIGMASGDIDGDGLSDVAAGGLIYLNPGSPGRTWRRTQVSEGGDIIRVLPFRRYGWSALLAVRDARLTLITAASADGKTWFGRTIGVIPRHGLTQGVSSHREPDQRESVYFTRGQALFRVVLPKNLDAMWRTELVTDQLDEEGIVVTDLDGDGQTDIVGTERGSKRIVWLRPDGGDGWIAKPLAATLLWFDRLAVADIDGDGRLDVVYTEEAPTASVDAHAGWLGAPADRVNASWVNHTIVTVRSANSLHVQDLNGDGLPDLLLAEHTDWRPGEEALPDTETVALLNRGEGRFDRETIERGSHSSHLGALPVAVDRNGGIGVASVGWEQSCCVHFWRRQQPY